MVERRRHERYNVTLEAKYSLDNTVGIEAKTSTINLSEGGVLMPLNKAIKPGKKISLSLKLPYEGREVNATGKVMWKEPLDSRLGPEENAGIKFLDMDADSKIALVEYLIENK